MRNKKEFRRNASSFAKTNNIPYRLTKKLLAAKGVACEKVLSEIVLRQMRLDQQKVIRRVKELRERELRAMLREPAVGEVQGLWKQIFKTVGV